MFSDRKSERVVREIAEELRRVASLESTTPDLRIELHGWLDVCLPPKFEQISPALRQSCYKADDPRLRDVLAGVAARLPIGLVCRLTCTGRFLRDYFRGRRNADNDGEEWDVPPCAFRRAAGVPEQEPMDDSQCSLAEWLRTDPWCGWWGTTATWRG